MAPRKHISTRERVRLFLLHGGICHICDGKIDATRERWEVSHDIPLELGGADDDENRKLAHEACHRQRTATVDAPAIAKSRRRQAAHIGAKAPSRHPLPGGRQSAWKKKLDGTVVRR